ncbi:hypothetical protein FRB99_007303 [Tulasnella sp. 403]|nr:hypothetical protein FRB99_007303 [Tulasnella sp. 403]
MPPAASQRMLGFLSSLPDYAFDFSGDASDEYRYLYSAAPLGTYGDAHSLYPRVVYRGGWLDQQPSRVSVLFVLPRSPGYGQEIFVIHIHVSAWGLLTMRIWKQLVIRYASLGVAEFPVIP